MVDDGGRVVVVGRVRVSVDLLLSSIFCRLS